MNIFGINLSNTSFDKFCRLCLPKILFRNGTNIPVRKITSIPFIFKFLLRFELLCYLTKTIV